jgi:glycosyltransferase involved in cell wall biosynthesis
MAYPLLAADPPPGLLDTPHPADPTSLGGLADEIVLGRVLHVITGLETGGAEKLLYTIASAARERGSPGHVVTLLDGGSLRPHFAAAGIRVTSLGMERGKPSLRGLVRLARLIRRERPAIVQSWLYHANLAALAGLLLSRVRARLYWGIYCSQLDFDHYRLSVRATNWLCARLASLTDGIVYNSCAGIEAHRAFGYGDAPSFLVENAVDAAQFRPDPELRRSQRASLGIPDGAVVAIAVARVDPMKDWRCLLRATAGIDGLITLLVGAGTEHLPAGPGQMPLGRRDDIAALMAAADLFVMASAFGEGSSVALNEAMAVGLPVVATDVGDSRRLVEGCGLIVPPRDAAALAEAICTLIHDPETARRLGAQGRRRMLQHHSVDQMIGELCGLYRGRAAPAARAS